MVGSLGANASAAIGLVSTSTWLMGGIGMAVSAGFSVQVAQYIGAGEAHNARRVLKHGFIYRRTSSKLVGVVVSMRTSVTTSPMESTTRSSASSIAPHAPHHAA